MRRDTSIPAIVVLSLMVVTAVALVFSYRQQVVNLKQDIYTQCQSRVSYDMSSQATRVATRRYFEDYITEESHNKFIDDSLRAERVAGARNLIAAINDTLGKTVPGGCVQYKP